MWTRNLLDKLEARTAQVAASGPVMGVTYKADVNDIRESPAPEIIEMVEKKGAQVSYADPFTPEITVNGLKLNAIEASPGTISAMDCVVVLTGHSSFDWAIVAERARLVVDTRNALRAHRHRGSAVVTL